MLTEKNFADALIAMNFTRTGDRYEKIFADNVKMSADFATRKLFFPAQIKGRDRNNFFDETHRENLVVFECVNRLLEKGYNPADIVLEKLWSLGHTQKSGRADICVSSGGKTLVIIECKTFGAEFNRERDNMLFDGGQLFSYWQQEQSCQWLVLYASDFDNGKLTSKAASVPCGEKFYRDAHTVEERFKIWRDRYDKKILDDVIFHEETVAYKIGAKPLRKSDLKEFEDTGLVNQFEEILRHNQVSDKENAFNRLVALFICKLVDEKQTPDDGELSFQFRDGIDTNENFQDRLQKLYADGMEKFMGENIFYLPEEYPDRLFKNFGDAENHDNQIRDLRENFRKLKFYTNNAFAFVDVNNDKLFYINAKVLKEVVEILRGHKIIDTDNLKTLGEMFEQLIDKGFKQNEGQFFTPPPIAKFIWDSLPLDKIISDEPPKIIDYACGAGHFLTEGFRAVNDCFARKNLSPPPLWERDKIFGVEKDYRLARVSKISLFMHGAGEGKIKFGDGLEDYPDEKISPKTFDVLVANPPYSVKGFKLHLKLANEENFSVLKKISPQGSEIETLFAERISQLVKPRGVAAVILPSSILNKDGKSFVAARKSLLENFFVRAIVELGSKTFGATGTKTVVMFLERFDEPPSFTADYMDVAQSVFEGRPLNRQFSREIFDAYLKKINVTADDYRAFIANADDKTRDVERDKIFYFGLTFRQTTLVIAAPADIKEQEIFLGYGWSNAKGREGMVDKKTGGLLFDEGNRAAENTLAAVVRAAFVGQQIQNHPHEKFFHYATLADMLDFDADNFTKKITLSELTIEELTTERNFPTTKLDNIVKINSATFDPTKTPEKIFHYVDIGSVDSATNRIDFSTTVTGAAAPSRARRWANNGDVLISTVRPYLKSFAQIKDAPPDTLYSTGFAVLSTKNSAVITNEFIFRLFMDDALLMEQMKAKMSKGSYPSINQDNLKNFHLLLPPLDVQKKIVDEFKAVDAQIAAQDDMLRQLDADIQKKFAALFSGYFSAKNYSFATLCKDDTASGVKFQTSEYLTAGDVPIIDQGANEIAGYMNTEGNPSPYNNLPCVIFGDHTEIFKLEREKFYLGADGTKIIIPSDRKQLDATFLFYMLRAEYKPLGGYARHFKNLKSLKLYLPPLELQEKFAAYVANCETLKNSCRARREKLIGERAELVTKYFR